MFKKENVILGLGIIKIDDVDVGYTRGGGQFTVERTFRTIKADGDRGKHIDSVILDEEIAKLKMNIIELIPENIIKIIPAIKNTLGVIEPTGKVVLADYHKVTWIGKNKKGKEVKIELAKAINLENIDWTLAEKDEVVQTLTFEACYEELSDISAYQAPYKMTFAE